MFTLTPSRPSWSYQRQHHCQQCTSVQPDSCFSLPSTSLPSPRPEVLPVEWTRISFCIPTPRLSTPAFPHHDPGGSHQSHTLHCHLPNTALAWALVSSKLVSLIAYPTSPSWTHAVCSCLPSSILNLSLASFFQFEEEKILEPKFRYNGFWL